MKSFIQLSVVGSLLLWATGAARGQSVVSGAVQESSGKPLPYANVLLVNATDSALVKGVVTTETGQFLVESVRNGTYRVVASGVGYQKNYSLPFTLDGAGNRHTVPPLLVAPEATRRSDRCSPKVSFRAADRPLGCQCAAQHYVARLWMCWNVRRG